MPDTKRRWTDRNIEVALGNLLRAGVIISAIVVLAGGILYFVQSGGATTQLHVFRGVPACRVADMHILAGAFWLRGECVIMLGLLLLIATPVARVLFSAIAFSLEGDRTYVLITLVVLGLLLASLLSGRLS